MSRARPRARATAAAIRARAVTRARQPRASEPRVRVAVLGAGIAGLTAAYRLAERGYEVTLFESRPYVGGQFSAHTHGNGYFHEHAFHMLLTWYNNFWRLAADIGLPRETHFEPRERVRYLRRRGERDGPLRPMSLGSPGSPRNIWANMFSGVQAPADMFLYAYSLIDLLTQRFPTDRLLGECSVDAFMESRPYASEGSAAMHELTLAKAFANPSYLTSARSYQRFIKFGFRHPDPMLWVLKGDCERHFNAHLTARLRDLGADIRLNADVYNLYWRVHHTAPVPVISVANRSAGPMDPCVEGGAPVREPAARRRELPAVDVNYVIMATPPKGALRPMATQSVEDARDFGALSHLESVAMASLDLYFTRTLPGLPAEHVILLDSAMGLAFIDNSRLWPGERHTVLNVVAADFNRFALLDPVQAQNEIIRELREYIAFEPARDLDQSRTHFQRHIGGEIFLNEVGSDRFRPSARTTRPWLFQAGAHCRTFIDVTTIEGAVVSGLEAARALQAQAVEDFGLTPEHRLARPIDVIVPDAHPDAGLMALKIMMAPLAFAAKCWSWASEQTSVSQRDAPVGDLATTAVELMFAPYAVASDWFRTGLAAYARVLRSVVGSAPGHRKERVP